MNILILVSTLNFGGAEKQALLDANMLSKVHNVYFATFYGGELEAQLSKEVKINKFRKTNYIQTAIQIASFVHKNNIHLIHAHLFASSVISALAGLLSGVKVIWHFHGHRYEEEQKGKRALSLLSRLPNVKKLLFVNTELIEYYHLEGYRFPKNKCMLMHNSSQQYTPLPDQDTKDKLIIGFIGRIVELKRVEYMVELAAWLKKKGLMNFSVDIIGDGPELNNLKELSIQLNIDDKIFFRGFQSDTLLYYSTFDLFILPSREECLSLALIDAGVFGIHAIAFQVGGNDEIINDGETGYIIQTKEALFEKTYYLLSNPEERSRMKKLAQSYCKSKFGETTHLETLLSLYKSI